MKKRIEEVMHDLAKVSDLDTMIDVSIDPTVFLKANGFSLTDENLIEASNAAQFEYEWLLDMRDKFGGAE